jgi:hypothetical protein
MTNPEINTPQSDKLALILSSPPVEESHISNITDYERSLFDDGIYIIDLSTELADAERDIAHTVEYYNNHPSYKRQDGLSLEKEIIKKRWALAWGDRFNGQVPDGWAGGGSLVMQDIEEAGKRGIQLSTTLIDAAVSHRSDLVGRHAGVFQNLNTHQLAIIFARDLPALAMSQVVEEQVKRGMTDEQLSEARKLAEIIRQRMAAGVSQLSSGESSDTKTPAQSPKLAGVLKGIVSLK